MKEESKSKNSIYSFEGRYEKQDGSLSRYFEVTQLKKGGFLISGIALDISSGLLKPFNKVYSMKKNSTEELAESLKKAVEFITRKTANDYKHMGGIDTIQHPSYHYPESIVKQYKSNKINIINVPIDGSYKNSNASDLSFTQALDELF